MVFVRERSSEEEEIWGEQMENYERSKEIRREVEKVEWGRLVMLCEFERGKLERLLQLLKTKSTSAKYNKLKSELIIEVKEDFL